MKVLVACEFSGVVRDAFRRQGHDAWSCDLPGVDVEGVWFDRHIYTDVRKILDQGWDLMIAHPPCTFLANSGVCWLYGGKGKTRDEQRWRNMEKATKFFNRMLDAPIPKIVVENPVMHKYGREKLRRPYNQTIQPWQFGHGETKATCLWLKGVPPLVPTNIVEGRLGRVWRAPPSKDRWKERSRTLPGVADAMANQWGRA